MAQGIAGNGGVDILGKDGGIFETDGSAFKFPEFQDTNVDSLTVGNDKALAFGNMWGNIDPTATNNLEIKKNQDSGECTCCKDERDRNSPGESCQGNSCQDCCIKVNLEQVKVGDREAMAFGFATATNNIKVVTNQQ